MGGVYNGEIGNRPLQVDPESTGGFSSMDENPIQPWQTQAVATFLNTKGLRPLAFNHSRRCCPDVSIFDSQFYIVQDGEDTPIGGTSAAAPVLGGMVALLNDELMNAGKPPLGFLNYFLYKNSAAFLDITKGNNRGYEAVQGYDPASGLGTFGEQTFARLKEAAMSR